MLKRLVCALFGHSEIEWSGHFQGECVTVTRCLRCGHRTETQF